MFSFYSRFLYPLLPIYHQTDWPYPDPSLRNLPSLQVQFLLHFLLIVFHPDQIHLFRILLFRLLLSLSLLFQNDLQIK